MTEDEQRAYRALTLLVAVCEQTTLELERVGWRMAPLLHRLQETHDLAVDLIRSRLDNAGVKPAA